MKKPTITRATRRLAASLAIITALATGGAWAADRTVSADTTLTADTTVDALTVNSGVTLNLNGYSLTCTSLAGSGTITSPTADTDLTSPDTDGTHVTWSTKDGVAVGAQSGSGTNLFNNTSVTSSQDCNTAGKRILVATSKLPLDVTYDFGDGTPRCVNKYSIVFSRTTYENAGSVNFKRGPKEWTFKGSNDNSTWTELHLTNDVTWAKGDSPKAFAFSNDTAYRYYRITFEASDDGSWLELNQLEYFNTNIEPGELHVADGATVTVPSGLTISGNVKIVRDGTGKIYDPKNLNIAADSTVTVVGDFSIYLSGNPKICNSVGDGGKFEFTGDIIANGGTTILSPCANTVGTGVVAAKGLVNNADSDNCFNLVIGINGRHANWLIGENGLSGTRTFAVPNNSGASAKITAASDFTVSAGIAVNNALELDTAGNTITIATNFTGSGAMTFSGSGTVAVNSGVSLGTGGVTLGAGTTLALTADSSTFTALTNALNLPTEGTATIRIDGARLSSGDHTILSNVAAGATANVTLDMTSPALAGRRATLEVDGTNLVLTIKPGGMILIVR